MNVKPEIIQSLIEYLLFQYSQSITRTVDGKRTVIRILDAWEYINRRLAGTSIGEVEKALDELEMVGLMRNGYLIAPESVDQYSKSQKIILSERAQLVD